MTATDPHYPINGSGITVIGLALKNKLENEMQMKCENA